MSPFVVFVIALTIVNGAPTKEKLLPRVIDAVDRAIKFFSSDYSSINVDGLFGLRIGQGKWHFTEWIYNHGVKGKATSVLSGNMVDNTYTASAYFEICPHEIPENIFLQIFVILKLFIFKIKI